MTWTSLFGPGHVWPPGWPPLWPLPPAPAAHSVVCMPSHLHELLIEMFRDRPALAADLLSGPFGIAVPEFHEAQLSAGELTDVPATEYRADAVVTLNMANAPIFAVVVEVQLRPNRRKRQ